MLVRRKMRRQSLLEQQTVGSTAGHRSRNRTVPDTNISRLDFRPSSWQYSLYLWFTKKSLKPSSQRFVSARLKRSWSPVWVEGSVSRWPTPCRSFTRKWPHERSKVKCEKACVIRLYGSGLSGGSSLTNMVLLLYLMYSSLRYGLSERHPSSDSTLDVLWRQVVTTKSIGGLMFKGR